MNPAEQQYTEFVWIRHGESLDNRDRLLVGGNADLSEHGIRQTILLAYSFLLFEEASTFTEFWCSPLLRAVRSMEELQEHMRLPLGYQISEDLIERRIGEWEGKTRAETYDHVDNRAQMELEGMSFRPPGGESQTEVGERALRFMTRILLTPYPSETADSRKKLKPRKVLIMSHGVTIRCAVLAAMRVKGEGNVFESTVVENTSQTRIYGRMDSHHHSHFRIDQVNDYHHLKGLEYIEHLKTLEIPEFLDNGGYKQYLKKPLTSLRG